MKKVVETGNMGVLESEVLGLLRMERYLRRLARLSILTALAASQLYFSYTE